MTLLGASFHTRLPVFQHLRCFWLAALHLRLLFSQYLIGARRNVASTREGFLFSRWSAGGDVYEERCCWLEIFQQTHMHRLKLIARNRLVILLFSDQAVGTMQVWLIHAQSNHIRCLYDGSSNCVTFLWWDLPEHLLYDSVAPRRQVF